MDNWRTVATIRPDVSLVMASPVVYPIVSDHLGSPRKILDQAGTLLWSWTNTEPYGNQAPNELHSGNSFTYDGRFPGQRFDRSTGTLHNGFRTYSPKLGRYMQSDPLGLEAGWNTFAYVEGNSMSGVDPLGLVNWTKRTAAVLNVANAGRLAAAGAIRLGLGGVITATGVGAAPGASAVAWGGWNIMSAQKAYQRGLKLWGEAPCEDTPDDIAGKLKNLAGVLPYGDQVDDANEPYFVDLIGNKAKNAALHPGEFIIEIGTGGL